MKKNLDTTMDKMLTLNTQQRMDNCVSFIVRGRNNE